MSSNAHYIRIGTILRALATGPKTVDQISALTGNSAPNTLALDQKRLAALGFVITRASRVLTLQGGATHKALAPEPETIAQQIADQWGNDGSNFVGPKGIDLNGHCDRLCHFKWQHDAGGTVYVMFDDSMIGTLDDLWDVLTERDGGWYDSNGERWAVSDRGVPAGLWR